MSRKGKKGKRKRKLAEATCPGKEKEKKEKKERKLAEAMGKCPWAFSSIK